LEHTSLPGKAGHPIALSHSVHLLSEWASWRDKAENVTLKNLQLLEPDTAEKKLTQQAINAHIAWEALKLAGNCRLALVTSWLQRGIKYKRQIDTVSKHRSLFVVLRLAALSEFFDIRGASCIEFPCLKHPLVTSVDRASLSTTLTAHDNMGQAETLTD
jgi:hypothetical protein